MEYRGGHGYAGILTIGTDFLRQSFQTLSDSFRLLQLCMPCLCCLGQMYWQISDSHLFFFTLAFRIAFVIICFSTSQRELADHRQHMSTSINE